MVQPCLRSVVAAGERALLYPGARHSQAVRTGLLLRRGQGIRRDRDSTLVPDAGALTRAVEAELAR